MKLFHILKYFYKEKLFNCFPASDNVNDMRLSMKIYKFSSCNFFSIIIILRYTCADNNDLDFVNEKKKKWKWKTKNKQNLFSRSPSLLFFIWFLTAQSPTIFLATFLVLLHTSAGNFDVCSRQSNGRHSHVETDVIIEKKALIGRGPILHEGFFFDADWRLRTVFVNFITTITVSFLTFLFLPFTSTFISSRFAIFVLFIGK